MVEMVGCSWWWQCHGLWFFILFYFFAIGYHCHSDGYGWWSGGGGGCGWLLRFLWMFFIIILMGSLYYFNQSGKKIELLMLGV